jgi:hypothetical protein
VTESSQDDVTVWNYVELHIRQNSSADITVGGHAAWSDINTGPGVMRGNEVSALIPGFSSLQKGSGARIALFSLLRIMLRLSDGPPEFVRSLQPKYRQIATEGRQLREKHRALIVQHCPLPSVLTNIVHGYAEPITGRDVSAWTRIVDSRDVKVSKKGSWFSRMFSCSGSASTDVL